MKSDQSIKGGRHVGAIILFGQNKNGPRTFFLVKTKMVLEHSFWSKQKWKTLMDKLAILEQIRIWNMILDSDYPSATVDRFSKLLATCRQELEPKFKLYSWEDQLWIMTQEPNPVIYSLLDSEQKAAYKLIQD
jgi:hypothetical protein